MYLLYNNFVLLSTTFSTSIGATDRSRTCFIRFSVCCSDRIYHSGGYSVEDIGVEPIRENLQSSPAPRCIPHIIHMPLYRSSLIGVRIRHTARSTTLDTLVSQPPCVGKTWRTVLDPIRANGAKNQVGCFTGSHNLPVPDLR